ncbi:MAG: DUF362 domain-containing protein [Candidatus Omnitrophica bacterium]|nr:DUF362 domain-containing protein [Candidatus Omnitrophota bacterium]
MEYFEKRFRALLQKKFTRNQFVRSGLWGTVALSCGAVFLKLASAFAQPENASGRPKKGIKGDCDLAVSQGDNPYQTTVKAIEALGGMSRFVAKGSVVLIKPNIGWDRTPEQAGNTNPEVVAALIDLCKQAGAKRVNVFDSSCNEARRCYAASGIQRAAEEHGANIFYPSSWNVVQAKFSQRSAMENWPIFREALECDTFINVPILKHHGLTRLTLSMKNLMGVCGGNRGQIHFDIGKKLVDLTGFINPDLTVIDAMRVLTRHGPQGGSLDDVVAMNTVIAGTDPTLCDSYACTLMREDPLAIPYIQEAVRRGFGSADIAKATITRV